MEPTKPTESVIDETVNLDYTIKELQRQLKAVEAFANVVVEQRNEALTEAAKYKSQLVLHLT